MAESYSTTLEWNGSVEVGRRLAGIALVGAASEIVVSDNMATLTIKVDAESLESLRESVDAVLALLSDHDS
jgi:hypothetical protein